jgi:hypothetical protein
MTPNKIRVQMVHNLDNCPQARPKASKQASMSSETYDSMPLTTRGEFWRLPLPVWGGERARGCHSGETRTLCTVPGCGSGVVSKDAGTCKRKRDVLEEIVRTKLGRRAMQVITWDEYAPSSLPKACAV